MEAFKRILNNMMTIAHMHKDNWKPFDEQIDIVSKHDKQLAALLVKRNDALRAIDDYITTRHN